MLSTIALRVQKKPKETNKVVEHLNEMFKVCNKVEDEKWWDTVLELDITVFWNWLTKSIFLMYFNPKY